ncbi:MAG: bifunctional folylpolyglutamate synthase/dihydrofolate synthase [Planctomycetota bacterium]|nr:MAG: bifunctional folylpolyglutamate synthase/dihydrofolate synthase [Planctomycetota bacterium]
MVCPIMAKTTAAPPRGRKKTTRSRSASAPRGPKIGTYTDAVRYLTEDRLDLERTRLSRLRKTAFKLDRMRALARAMDNPQDELRIVHVAGTKGKGSVCEMVTGALSACGFTVGLYTSPHLVDLRERIRVGGEMITYPAFAKAMQAVAKAAAKVERRHGPATFFELLTMAAFRHFAHQAVDIAVIECGLGGRLDATNIVRPEVTAVTGISLDHTGVLGATEADIAREKAGIFKKGVPALTFQQPAPILQAMREVAEAAGTTLEVVGKDVDFSSRFESTPKYGPHTCVCLNTPRSAFEHLVVPLPGEHQALNCGLALGILDRLRALGFDTPETKVIAGLEGLKIPGRMELALPSPRVLLDGAHNAASIQALMKTIGLHVPYDSMVVIFGCSEDKDADGMLRRLALGADKVIFTRARGNPRALDPHDLRARFGAISGKMAQVEETLPAALKTAARAVGRDDLICVTGSFYLVGEAKKHLAQRLAHASAQAARA